MATASDYLLHRLHAWGVERIYGYPGDGINGVLGALNRDAKNGHHFRFVQARHEEMAALMACGHAKFTGQVGVCLATSGPGAIHLLNGLYDAKLDHAPVLAIVGQAARSALGGSYQQEVDLQSLFKDVAHEYVHVAMSADQIRHLVDRAMRTALSERTVTCLILPKDVQELDAIEAPKHAHDTVHSSSAYSRPCVIPSDADLLRAAEILNTGKRVAMLVGAGALEATDEILLLADALGAGVAKALLGLAAVPDDVPFVTGAIGLVGTKASAQMMSDCDTLLVVGSSFPYSEFLPREGQARGVQIDIDGRMLGLRYPMELNLVGDAKETMRALLPYIEPKRDRAWQSTIEENVRAWRSLLDERAHVAGQPMNPERVFWELSQRLPDSAILTADSGTAATWFARDLCLRRGMMSSLSGSLATMGPAVPYAIAAKFNFPDRPVIAFAGDGAMQMNGNAELLTIAKYWREWRDPRLIVTVLNNGDLSMVTWEMRAMAGDSKYAASQDLPPFPFAAYADLIGLRGIRVGSDRAMAEAWDVALASDRPVVLEALTDPDVPPLPPHITLDEAKAFAMSMAKSGEGRGGVVKEAFKHMFPSFAVKD